MRILLAILSQLSAHQASIPEPLAGMPAQNGSLTEAPQPILSSQLTQTSPTQHVKACRAKQPRKSARKSHQSKSKATQNLSPARKVRLPEDQNSVLFQGEVLNLRERGPKIQPLNIDIAELLEEFNRAGDYNLPSDSSDSEDDSWETYVDYLRDYNSGYEEQQAYMAYLKVDKN